MSGIRFARYENSPRTHVGAPGAGRHATVTTEALTLASGGQRTLLAAYALLQALLPALAFGAAWWLGRRQSRRLGLEIA